MGDRGQLRGEGMEDRFDLYTLYTCMIFINSNIFEVSHEGNQ